VNQGEEKGKKLWGGKGGKALVSSPTKLRSIAGKGRKIQVRRHIKKSPTAYGPQKSGREDRARILSGGGRRDSESI